MPPSVICSQSGYVRQHLWFLQAGAEPIICKDRHFISDARIFLSFYFWNKQLFDIFCWRPTVSPCPEMLSCAAWTVVFQSGLMGRKRHANIVLTVKFCYKWNLCFRESVPCFAAFGTRQFAVFRRATLQRSPFCIAFKPPFRCKRGFVARQKDLKCSVKGASLSENGNNFVAHLCAGCM